ncbi:MAG: hypothetical protein ACHBN1_38220 [Heteroscytonema crispum UTEX LB 1556]
MQQKVYDCVTQCYAIAYSFSGALRYAGNRVSIATFCVVLPALTRRKAIG